MTHIALGPIQSTNYIKRDALIAISVHTVNRPQRANNLAALSLVVLLDAQYAGRHASRMLLANNAGSLTHCLVNQ